MSPRAAKTSLSRWPVFVALGLVTALIGGMLGLDLFFAQRVARETEDILENSLSSIVLLQDIRTQVTRMLAAELRNREVRTLIGAIAADSQAFESKGSY